MNKPALYIVDVFSEEKYAGNQLAVIRDAAGLSDTEMLKITREFKFSEATFILSDEMRNGGYDVRIFTPQTEVPFAGHPTLGTAYIIQREIIGKPVEKVILNLKIGQIPVTFSYNDGNADILWMKQKAPVFGDVYAHSIGLTKEDIDTKYPVQDVSTGLPFIICPLKSLAAVKRAKVNKEEYFSLFNSKEPESILVFCRESYNRENHLNVRVFAENHGIPEDPATGSGNGCLAGYLAKYRYFGKEKVDIRVEQGYEMGRPSLLFLRSEDKAGKIDVDVGGKVVMVARGELA
jgi:trans-2,3-dihydro-3-hydroxyanthranilate isomerase